MSLKRFEEFLESGAVKKQAPNKQRALSIIEEIEGKKRFLETSLAAIPQEEMNANFIVDTCYDIMIELIRAKMLLDGFNAGPSHEAEVSYMDRLGFTQAEMRIMDEIRYYRNGTKYYGTILTKQYAEKTLRFMKKIYPVLKKLLS
ncbi:MAG TPA: hypothetical protein VJ461_02935 [Candidatus Nanoarchaeia archaeon]|nr:hypothetical protein [Candidatus Nanoarchaeia archaeon]